MRIQMNEHRERVYETLVDVSNENAKSKAIDAAASYYIQMNKDHGVVDELMRTAIAQGSLTPAEIAEIVDTAQVPVTYDSEYTIGKE